LGGVDHRHSVLGHRVDFGLNRHVDVEVEMMR
jgi:hypothetical protein